MERLELVTIDKAPFDNDVVQSGDGSEDLVK